MSTGDWLVFGAVCALIVGAALLARWYLEHWTPAEQDAWDRSCREAAHDEQQVAIDVAARKAEREAEQNAIDIEFTRLTTAEFPAIPHQTRRTEEDQ